MRRTATITIALGMTIALVLAGCGDDDDTSTGGGSDDRPTVAVTTNILGDVVTSLVGGAAEVVVIMPAGSDPHDFQASAQQVQQMSTADALVTNGASFETGLGGAIETAEDEGVPTHHAIDAVETLDFTDDAHGHEEEEGEAHADDEDAHAEEEEAHAEEEEAHAEEEGTTLADEEGAETTEGEEEHEHEHEGVDPHFFTDPSRVRAAAAGIAAFLAEEIPALATDEVRTDADAYLDELDQLDASVEETLSVIPDDQRILITNHEVFGYFADRYDFEVVGVVIPGGTTGGEPSAENLHDLVHIIEEEGVPAIFADTSSPTQLADTLAAEADTDVEVVEVFSESLGEEGSGGETYIDMVTTNADRIADALA